MTDLIMQAEAAGCVIKNHLYALWEIQKWLREEKEIDIDIETYLAPGGTKIVYVSYVVFTWCLEDTDDDSYFNTYEEALMDAIKEAFRVLKEHPKPCLN